MQGCDTRPLLLIDVDGVLNPIGLRPPDHVPPGFEAYRIDGLRVLLSRQHGVWLTELAADYDLAWATSWERDADRQIAERVGMPRDLPVITFDPAATGWMDKLPSVIDFVGDRAAAWVDDDLGPNADAWAASRSIPTLLIQTDHRVGLTIEHVQRLRTFALEVRA